jgi:hypothetical protein
MRRMEYYEPVQSFSATPMERKLKSCKWAFCNNFGVLVLAQVQGLEQAKPIVYVFIQCLQNTM